MTIQSMCKQLNCRRQWAYILLSAGRIPGATYNEEFSRWVIPDKLTVTPPERHSEAQDRLKCYLDTKSPTEKQMSVIVALWLHLTTDKTKTVAKYRKYVVEKYPTKLDVMYRQAKKYLSTASGINQQHVIVVQRAFK